MVLAFVQMNFTEMIVLKRIVPIIVILMVFVKMENAIVMMVILVNTVNIELVLMNATLKVYVKRMVFVYVIKDLLEMIVQLLTVLIIVIIMEHAEIILATAKINGQGSIVQKNLVRLIVQDMVFVNKVCATVMMVF